MQVLTMPSYSATRVTPPDLAFRGVSWQLMSPVDSTVQYSPLSSPSMLYVTVAPRGRPRADRATDWPPAFKVSSVRSSPE